MQISQTRQSDFPAIYDIHCQAFGHDKEADLVAALLSDPTALPGLSLIARESGEGAEPLGHVLFTRVAVISGRDGADCGVPACLLAPLAVVPGAQGRGVGQALVREGLTQLARDGMELVFVLGHPGYYPRCGFEPAGQYGFAAPYPIPEEHAGAWMLHALSEEARARYSGTVRCADSLNRPEYWRE